MTARASGLIPDRAALQRCAATLLDIRASRGAIGRAAESLHENLLGLSGLEEAAGEAPFTLLPSGRALSPIDAARCTRDPIRTAVFLRGVSAAVAAAPARVAGRPVEVLYAGTGPFAPFALPLMALLDPGQVRFTLLDVHGRSVAAATRLVRRFGFEAFVRELREADATLFQPAAGKLFDVVVVEAMQRSLGIEPQVALTRHLSRFLGGDGFVVPGRVRVDLALSNPASETADGADPASRATGRVLLGPVFELTRESAGRPLDARGRLPPVSVTLPVGTGGGIQPMLFTTVQAFGPHVLEEGDSGLTFPDVLWKVPPLPAGARLEFRYQLGRDPGLRCEWGGKAEATAPGA
jgi:hypothetical protein